MAGAASNPRPHNPLAPKLRSEAAPARPLYTITRTYTTPAGEIDMAVVEAKAQADFATGRYRSLDELREAHLRGARHEQWDIADKIRRNGEYAVQLEREAADAEALAASYGYHVETIQFHRDRFFWGTWSDRSIELPRHERALKIAQTRAATPILEAAE